MLYKTAFSIYKSTINIGNREISYELTAGACPQGHPENRHDCKGGTLSQDKYEGTYLCLISVPTALINLIRFDR